jgi:excisionase family DNA binding protein
MATPPPKLYTVREAAAILRVTPKTIRRRILNHQLLATKPRGAHNWLIPEGALKTTVNEGIAELCQANECLPRS